MTTGRDIVKEFARLLNLPDCATKAVITLDPNAEPGHEATVEVTMLLPDDLETDTFKYDLKGYYIKEKKDEQNR